MHVVQPNPIKLKQSLSRSFCRPDLSRYSATTCEPGASEVFTHGWTGRPLARALRASRPAPIITLGFEVLVQDVIAAITTSPWPRSWLRPWTEKRLGEPALANFVCSAGVAIEGCNSNTSLRPPSPALLTSFTIEVAKPFLTSLRAMRSCGRLGPASDGSTDARSSLSTSVKIGSGVVFERYMPCALA